MEKIPIDLGDKYFQVGESLPIVEKVELIFFLIKNLDVFAWSSYEAFGVDSMSTLDVPRRSGDPVGL